MFLVKRKAAMITLIDCGQTVKAKDKDACLLQAAFPNDKRFHHFNGDLMMFIFHKCLLWEVVQGLWKAGYGVRLYGETLSN